MRYAVFGDVGGHLGPYSRGLESVGVDLEQRRIPEDLTVVQVGDIVHKGPDSNGVLELVSDLARGNPGRYIQLPGNHEIQYLIGTRPFISETLDSTGESMLRALYDQGFIQPSYAFTASSGDYLVTHAGLTRPNHVKWAGEHADAHQTSAALNALDWRDMAEPGTMLYGIDNHEAGIFWAESAHEVYASWNAAAEVVPSFHQIHGHSTLRVWTRYNGLLRDHYEWWLAGSMRSDFNRMHTVWDHKGMAFHGIDNKFEKEAHAEMVFPLVIE